MANTEYIQRLQFCSRVIKVLNLGGLHVMNIEFKPTYNLVNKRGVVTYSFSNLDKLERFLEKRMSRRTPSVVSGKPTEKHLNMRCEGNLPSSMAGRTIRYA